MLESKATIRFALAGIAIVIGFGIGIAPGYFLTDYVVFGLGLSLLLLIILILMIAMLLFEYQNPYEVLTVPSARGHIFNRKLSTKEKALLIFTIGLLFVAGIFLGVACELLLKVFSVHAVIHILIVIVVIVGLLVLFVALLLMELCDRSSENLVEPVNKEEEQAFTKSDTFTKVLTKPKDGPQNTAARMNRYHLNRFNDEMKSTWSDTSHSDSAITSMNSVNESSTTKPKYKKLPNPSIKFSSKDKVYVNDNELAEVLEHAGVNQYRIQYVDTGRVAVKNRSELRKAVPLLN